MSLYTASSSAVRPTLALLYSSAPATRVSKKAVKLLAIAMDGALPRAPMFCPFGAVGKLRSEIETWLENTP